MKPIMSTGPFQRQKRSTRQMMVELTLTLVVVLIAALCFQFIDSYNKDKNFSNALLMDFRALMIVAVSLIATIGADFITAYLLKKRTWPELKKFFIGNYSYVTALIFALIVPVDTHLYVVAVGAFAATILGKAVFGGFGHNIVNPAIVGRVFIAICFGSTIKTSGVDIGQTFLTQWVTGDHGSAWLSSNLSSKSILDLLIGNYQGALGETFTLLIALIGIFLIVRGIIDYRLPLFYLLTILVGAFLIALISQGNAKEFVINDPIKYALLHLSLGGVMFGAVFMLTDPVSTPVTPMGKMIAAILAGVLTMLIRVKGGMVEGAMYAIFFVNLLTPWINSLSKGLTIDKPAKKMIQLGLVSTFGLLLVTLGGYRPAEKQPSSTSGPVIPQATKYVGTASSSGYDHDATITVEVWVNDGIDTINRVDIIYDYVTSGYDRYLVDTDSDFHAQYVSDGALVDKPVADVKLLFASSNWQIIVDNALVANQTATCEAYFFAMRNALNKVPASYSAWAQASYDGHDSSVTVLIKVKDGKLEDYTITYSNQQGDPVGYITKGFDTKLTDETESFYQTYVDRNVLIGKTVAELLTLFSGTNWQTVYSSGIVTSQSATCEAYFFAMQAALKKV